MTLLALVILIATVLLHTATAYWDVAYSAQRRHISPLEQTAHSYLELLPIFAVSILVVLNLGNAIEDGFQLRWREKPLPATGVTILIVLVLTVQGLPLLEELWRTARAQDKSTSSPRARPHP
jgi:hypothetical protein